MRPERPPQEFERRKRALRKRLALDFQPLRDTLAKGLELLIDPEAAVYCTATVEAFCDALFTAAIKELSESPPKGARLGPADTKLTVSHLQVALRSHPELAQLLRRVESAAVALEFFLDDATSRALYDRDLLASREARHLATAASPPRDHHHQQHQQQQQDDSDSHPGDAQAADEEELIRRHARTRSEWQKREDDPFSEVDFAMVLKCVHPAFTLSYNATMLLSALVRELLNEVCARADLDALQRRRHPPELLLDDLERPLAEVFCGATGHLPPDGALATHIARTADECLARFRLQSRRGKTLTLRFRVYQPGGSAALQPVHSLPRVARDAAFAQLAVQMRKKSHLPAPGAAFGGRGSSGELVVIYRAHEVEPTATPATLAMPTGAVVYLVARRWWDYTRRNEARRGLLSSQRPQDALVKSLVAGTESKVKKELQAAAAAAAASAAAIACSATAPGGNSPQLQHTKRGLRSSAGSSSAVSLLSACGSNVSVASCSPPRAAVATAVTGGQDEDSLSALLKARRPTRRSKEQPARQCLDTNGSDDDTRQDRDALSELTRQHDAQGPSLPSSSSLTSLGPLPVAHLAHASQQLMETLDGTWLEFAALTTGVRAATEQLAQWAAGGQEATPAELQALETEWLSRAEATEALAGHARTAHELATHVVQHMRQQQQQQQRGRRQRRVDV